jgi:replicative DNA helicase
MTVKQLPIKAAIESEKTVLGGLLLDSSKFEEITSQLCPNDFSLDIHGLIFETMQTIYAKRKVFDIPMILDEMVSKENDFQHLDQSLEFLLLELSNECPSVANIKSHADIIREKSVQRQLIKVANEISKEVSDSEVVNIKELLDDTERKVIKIAKDNDLSIYRYKACLVSFLRDLAEVVTHAELTENYLRDCIVEVNRAFFVTLDKVEGHNNETD